MPPIDFGKLGGGALQSVADSALSAGIGALSGSGSAHYQRRNFRENTHYANTLAIENAKNKYSYELESMRKAGINLATLGGNFQDAGVSGVSTGEASAPSMTGSHSSVSQNALNLASMENVESQTQKNSDESALFQSQKNYFDELAIKTKNEGNISGVDYMYHRQFVERQLQKLKADIDFINEQKGLTQEQKFQVRQKVDFLYQTWNAQVAYQTGIANEVNMKARLLSQEYDFNIEAMPKRLSLLAAQIVQTNSQARLNNSQADLAIKTIAQVDEVITSLKLDNRLKSETIDGAIEVAKLQYEAGKLRLLPEVEKLKGYLNKGKDDFQNMGVMQYEAEKNALNAQIQKALFEFRKARGQNTASDAYLSICAEVGMMCDALNLSCGFYSSRGNVSGNFNSISNGVSTNYNYSMPYNTQPFNPIGFR